MAELIADARKIQPRLIVVQTKASQALPPEFNMYEYLRYIGFVSAVIEPHYREIPARKDWRYFVRKDKTDSALQ